MSAPSSVCSDDSFEKLDPEELEDDAQPMYKPKVKELVYVFHKVNFSIQNTLKKLNFPLNM